LLVKPLFFNIVFRNVKGIFQNIEKNKGLIYILDDNSEAYSFN